MPTPTEFKQQFDKENGGYEQTVRSLHADRAGTITAGDWLLFPNGARRTMRYPFACEPPPKHQTGFRWEREEEVTHERLRRVLAYYQADMHWKRLELERFVRPLRDGDFTEAHLDEVRKLKARVARAALKLGKAKQDFDNSEVEQRKLRNKQLDAELELKRSHNKTRLSKLLAEPDNL